MTEIFPDIKFDYGKSKIRIAKINIQIGVKAGSESKKDKRIMNK